MKRCFRNRHRESAATPSQESTRNDRFRDRSRLTRRLHQGAEDGLTTGRPCGTRRGTRGSGTRCDMGAGGGTAPTDAGCPRKHLGHAQQARTRRPEPERARRRERRRRVAAGGWLPPTLAASFTPGEAAVMSVIGCEVMLRGRCELTNGELADLAGVGRTTVLRALRQAVRPGCSIGRNGA